MQHGQFRTLQRTGKSWLGSLVSGWSPGFKMVIVFSAVSSIGMTAFDQFLGPFLRDSGLPVATIGLFHGLISIIGCLSAPVGGAMTDALGRKFMVMAGRASRLVALAIVLLMPGVPGLLTGAVLLGLASVTTVAYTALVAESAPANRRATAFAITSSVRSAVSLIVPFGVGFLADRLGLQPVLAVSLIPLALSIAIARAFHETHSAAQSIRDNPTHQEGPISSQKRVQMTSRVKDIAFLKSRDRSVALVTCLMWLIIGVESGITGSIWGIWVRDRFGVSYSGLGAVAMLGSLGNMAANLAGGRLGDSAGRSRALLVSFGAGAVLWTITPYAPTVLVFSVVHLATTFVMCFAAPSWEALSASSVPREVRGFVTGLYNASSGAGAAAGAMIAGVLYRFSMNWPFRMMAISEASLLVVVVMAARAGLRAYTREAPVDND